MMYILLLIYFLNIVTGDDSSEAKYIDLLPEKEKEDFLETVARRIFDNIKHKNAIPEREEHTKLIEKVLKEESLNLKRVSQNFDDSNRKGNVVEKSVDALDLTQEGKRNKRNSLNETKNSDSDHVQRASNDTNKAIVNELSKELGVSDTEDIEVKHTNNKLTEVYNEEITTETNVEEIEAKITVGNIISKENSSSPNSISNYERERKTTISHNFKPEETKDTNEAPKNIETAKTLEHSFSQTNKINVTRRRNGHSEPINDSSKIDTEQDPVAITVKSLSTNPDIKFMEPTSNEALEKNIAKGLATNDGIKLTKSEQTDVAFANANQNIVTSSPKIKALETTTESSRINGIRKVFDKLPSNVDADNIKLDNITDNRDNQGTEAVSDDKTLTTKTVVTANNVKLDENYFDDESTAAVVDKNQNHSSWNDLSISYKENDEPVTQNINSTNSVNERENKDTKLSETIVNGTENSNETIIKVIKNSMDYINQNNSLKKNAVNKYNGTIIEIGINSMAQKSKVIVNRDPDIITTTTMDTLINNNKEINVEIITENAQNKSYEMADGAYAVATMQSNETKNGTEIVKETSKEILIDENKEIQKQNNTTEVSEIYKNKTEANYEKLSTESINITIPHDNSEEKTESSKAKIRLDKNVFEHNTIETDEGTTSGPYIETTTVKIETLTVATDLNKLESKDFRIKEDAKPYINQVKISKTPTPQTNHEFVKVFDNDDNKMEENLNKMKNISANFVNDMIKVIRSSFSDEPKENTIPLRFSDDNPNPKEYKVYKASNNEPLDQKYESKDFQVMQENPYYVPVYNYGPEHAYYNPKNRLGPNVDDDDVTIIKNDGLNIESIAHDYDSIVKDIGSNENDYTKKYYHNRQDLNYYDARNDVDYIEANNKERKFIDRMGDNKGNNIFTPNKNLRGRDTENTQKLKKEYMKNLVKIYKNHNSKNNNKQRNVGRYKLNLPIVINYPKYSDIIMNSHDYLDVDYRYPTWKKPKNSRYRKHRILRANRNNFPSNIIITSFADDPNNYQDDTVGVANPYADDQFSEDSNMFPDGNQYQETEKPFKIFYDDDHDNSIKKPLQDHYGKPNTINLFESEEYVWETQDTKENRNKKNMEDEKSLGVKNQIRKIREMMYSAANFGFMKPKKAEERNYSGLKHFIKEAPKMCDDEDTSCVEPFVLINNNHIHNKKQTNSARHAMNNSIASDYFIARTNNTSDFVVDYVPKLSARTNNFKVSDKDRFQIIDHIRIEWVADFSEIHDGNQFECSFCSNGVCYECICGTTNKFCLSDIHKPTPIDDTNQTKAPIDEDISNDDAEPSEEPTDEDIPNTTAHIWHWETVKNRSMVPSYLDPILKKKHPIFRSRNDELPLKTSLRDDNKSQEDNNTESLIAKPNIIKFVSPDEINDPNNPHPLEDYEIIDTKAQKPDITSHTEKNKYDKIKTIKSIMEIIPDDAEIMLKVSDMLEKQNSDEKEDDVEEIKGDGQENKGDVLEKEGDVEEKEGDAEEKEGDVEEKEGDVEEKEGDVEEKEGNVEEKEGYNKDQSKFLRSTESIDLESYVTVLQDMVRNEAKGLVQYDWMGTSIDIQAAIYKLKEMTESVKNNEVLDNLDFKLLKYFTFLHKFATKRQQDLRMFLPKPKYRYNRTRSERGRYSRTWLKRRLKKFAFEVSGIDLYYFTEFLEELQSYLYDLHTALTQIAMVTSYKNQNWFRNLNELYLDDSRKNMLELLLHVTTVRLLDLIEISVQRGLEDGFLKYVINNEKAIENSKNEMLLILRIIEELKNMK